MSGGAQEKGAKSEYYRATMLKNIGKKVEKLKSWSRLLKKGRVGDEMGREPVFGRCFGFSTELVLFCSTFKRTVITV